MYKSLLFLLLGNLFLIGIAGLFLDLRFLIPVVFFLIPLNFFLSFGASYLIKKNYIFSHFPMDDPYGVSTLFEDFKKKNPKVKVQLLKSQHWDCLYWRGFNQSYIVVSEVFLENFSKEQLHCFLAYGFKKVKTGDLFFLSVLAAFFYLTLKPAFLLSAPLFMKKSQKEQVFLQKGLIKFISFFTKALFYKIDRGLFESVAQKREQSFFLWNLENFTRSRRAGLRGSSGVSGLNAFGLKGLNGGKKADLSSSVLGRVEPALFLMPLYPIDPFVGYFEKSSSIHPPVKNRIKKLINTYPP